MKWWKENANVLEILWGIAKFIWGIVEIVYAFFDRGPASNSRKRAREALEQKDKQAVNTNNPGEKEHPTLIP